MDTPIQITFRNMEPSEAVDRRIRSEAEKLEKYFDHITSCRVVIEVPHRHHARGRHFHLRIELGVPGREIIVTREPSLHRTMVRSRARRWRKRNELQAMRRDPYIVIHDAFKEARRQVQDYIRQLRGDVKQHGHVRPERAAKLAAAAE